MYPLAFRQFMTEEWMSQVKLVDAATLSRRASTGIMAQCGEAMFTSQTSLGRSKGGLPRLGGSRPRSQGE